VQPCEEWEETLMLAVRSKAGGVILNPGPTYAVAAADAAIIVCARDKVAAAVKDIEKGITLPINSKGGSRLACVASCRVRVVSRVSCRVVSCRVVSCRDDVCRVWCR
jgi:putative aminopeptidase FrvX